jgi:N-acetyl-alpha-D-muramate 1-phosphate uridylyltransferase
VFRNNDRWGPSNAIYTSGRVVAYDKQHPTPDMSWIDYGLGGLTTDALETAQDGETDLALLYNRLAARSLLFGFEAHERFYEIGSPLALAETESQLR